MTPEMFRERFALATFADGGVVVDLQTGSYSRVNATGAVMLAAFEGASSMDAAADSCATRFGISGPTALHDLRALVGDLNREGVRTAPIGVLRYRPATDGGYDLWHGEQRALHVDAAARQLTLASPPETLPFTIFDYVSDIAPKLLFLLGVPILHGSSCVEGDGILGMCGQSRAGKTTTARTLAKHGSQLISEDLIVLDPDLSTPRVFVEAEVRVRRWFHDGARALEADHATALDLGVLREVATGSSLPLHTLWFLDAARRGDNFHLAAIRKTDGMLELLAHAFLGAEGETSWRRYIGASHAIIAASTPFQISLPNGLSALDEAIASYSTNSAS